MSEVEYCPAASWGPPPADIDEFIQREPWILDDEWPYRRVQFADQGNNDNDPDPYGSLSVDSQPINWKEYWQDRNAEIPDDYSNPFPEDLRQEWADEDAQAHSIYDWLAAQADLREQDPHTATIDPNVYTACQRLPSSRPGSSLPSVSDRPLSDFSSPTPSECFEGDSGSPAENPDSNLEESRVTIPNVFSPGQLNNRVMSSTESPGRRRTTNETTIAEELELPAHQKEPNFVTQFDEETPSHESDNCLNESNLKELNMAGQVESRSKGLVDLEDHAAKCSTRRSGFGQPGTSQPLLDSLPDCSSGAVSDAGVSISTERSRCSDMVRNVFIGEARVRDMDTKFISSSRKKSVCSVQPQLGTTYAWRQSRTRSISL
ncbi:hypothetical protein V8F33_013688 [Rhypophila sp. PSN 637]